MSDISAETAEQANFRDILARIDRQQAETKKLLAESDKFAVEQRKLAAETEKLARDRGLAPWTLAFVILGSLGGLVAGVATLLRLGSP